MSPAPYSKAELATFEDLFEQTPDWSSWRRVVGSGGEDVIEIDIAEIGRDPVHLAKRNGTTYLANGLGDWGLAVSEDFEGLLVVGGAAAGRSVGDRSDHRDLVQHEVDRVDRHALDREQAKHQDPAQPPDDID